MAGYAGDVTPQEAWDMVRDGAVLVDVRTVGEWEQIGVPDTSELGVETHFIEWVRAGGVLNPDFASELESIGIEPGSAARERRPPRLKWASVPRTTSSRASKATPTRRAAASMRAGRSPGFPG